MISFSFPNSQIQSLLFVIAILILSGVNSCSQNTSTNQTIASQCPTQPKGFLDSNNVREISLSNQAVKVSGMTTSNKSTGYSFEAKSGQNFKYQTKDDICVWIYTPDNQILNTTTLPQTGKYTLQVSTLQGSKTFEMEMALDSVQVSPTPTPTPTPTSTPTPTTASVSPPTQAYITPTNPEPQRPAADNFIREYYSDLNNRQYQKTWSRLSPEFQNISSSYFGYVGWWDSVREIKIGEVNLVNQNSESAIVDADLWYVMKRGGKPYRDPNKRIYLRWSDQDNSWLFIRKSKD